MKDIKFLLLFVTIMFSCYSPSNIVQDAESDVVTLIDITGSDTNDNDRPPEITSINPGSGYTDGGIDITISGRFFQNGIRVFFGDREAVLKSYLSSSAIIVVNPPHEEGKVDIKVENPDKNYGILKDGFEYIKKDEPVDECIPKKCEIKPTVFKYDSSKAGFQVTKVELAAQFTNWGENRITMNDEGVNGDEISGDGIYSAAVLLKSGDYEYKFILNGNQWINDPENSITEPVFKNSLITIEDGCLPQITNLSIKNGDVLNSSEIIIEVEYNLNGRKIDKSGSYFILDGKKEKSVITDEKSLISLTKNIEEGAHWYSVVLRDMECNRFISPSVLFFVKTSNKTPIANAGYTQIVEVGQKVILDGTLSEDPYQIGIDNFEWNVVSSPEAVELNDEYATDPAGYNNDPDAMPQKVRSLVSFTPAKEGYYRFSLKVSNQEGESSADETDVYVLSKSYSPDRPIVVVDIKNEDGKITIDASGSRGANSGNLSYIWIEDIRNPEKLNLSDLSTYQLMPTKDGAYFLYLIVNDGVSNSEVKKIFIFKKGDLIKGQDFSYSSDWLKASNIYEIFVRKFMDSDGDGIGDLRGLKERLMYLKELGVDTIWLMPIFRSNDKDHGYHTIDYYSVEPDYGDNDALIELIKESHKQGIKIILDMVINHTSRRHPFFIEALNMNPVFRDYYIWFENSSTNLYDKYGYGREMGGTRLTLETGWAEIPDINYANTAVRQYIYNMLKFWMDPDGDGDFSDGVDGFRIDHVTGPSHSVWMNLRRFVKSINPDAVLIAEVFRDFDNNNQGYGIKDYYNGEFDASFTFPYYWAINSVVNGSNKPDALDGLRADIRKKFVNGVTHSFFIQNHDIPYKSTALNEYGGYNEKGIAKQISAASLMFLFPDAPQVLYGEELGITEYRGFMPWENYSENNSIYNFYKAMYKLRKEAIISAKSEFYFIPNSQSDYIYSFIVKTEKDKILGVVNMKDVYVDTVSMNIGIIREENCGLLQLESILDFETKEIEANNHYLFLGPFEAYAVKFYRVKEKESLSPIKVKFLLNTESKSREIDEGRFAFISGDIIQLGNWVPNAIKMVKTSSESSCFETYICDQTHIEYKYLIDFGAYESWGGVEFSGENRKVVISGDSNNEMEIGDTFGIRTR